MVLRGYRQDGGTVHLDSYCIDTHILRSGSRGESLGKATRLWRSGSNRRDTPSWETPPEGSMWQVTGNEKQR